MRQIPIVMLVLLCLTIPAAAQSCPLPGQKPLLSVRLYFGLTEADGKTPITDSAWRDFLAHIVTPRFASGFTVYDVTGQWQDTRSHALTRENTRVLEVLAADTVIFRRQIAEIAGDYRTRFHAQSVGIVSVPACGTF